MVSNAQNDLLILTGILPLKSGILMERVYNDKLRIPGMIYDDTSCADNIAEKIEQELEAVHQAFTNKKIFKKRDPEIDLVFDSALGIYHFIEKHKRIKAFCLSLDNDTDNLIVNPNFCVIPADINAINNHQIQTDDKEVLLDYLKRQKSIRLDNFHLMPIIPITKRAAA